MPIEPAADTRVVTIRVSPALHDALKVLGHSQRQSMNTACVWALERAVYLDDEAASAYKAGKARKKSRNPP